MTQPVVHLTSRHPWDDVRIFHKMCRDLASDGRPVTLMTLDAESSGGTSTTLDGVHVLRLARGQVFGRFGGHFRLLRHALAARPCVVQAHDPDLIPILLLLRLMGIRTVFDAHENFVTQICARYPRQRLRRRVLRLGLSLLRWAADLSCHRIVCATAQVAGSYTTKKTLVVNNYPRRSDFTAARAAVPLSQRRARAVYVGSLAKVRGIREIVQAAHLCPSLERLDLVGTFDDENFGNTLRTEPGWAKVCAHGHLSRQGVADVLAQSRVGLVTLYPLENYLTARPVKMFEYLATGLPVIHSDFPAWSKILAVGATSDSERPKAGIAVEPKDPKNISAALYEIMNAPDLNERGADALRISRNYRWEPEGQAYCAMITDLTQQRFQRVRRADRLLP